MLTRTLNSFHFDLRDTQKIRAFYVGVIHHEKIMNVKIAGALNFICVFYFLIIWGILLLVAQPEALSTYEAAKSILIYALTEDGSEFFYLSIASMLVCFTCGVLLFLRKYPQHTMYITALHVLIGIYFYDWSLALSIGLPLLFFNKVRVNA